MSGNTKRKSYTADGSKRSLVNERRAAGSDLSANGAQPGDRRGRTGWNRRGDLSRRLAPADRAHALGRAGAVLSHDTSKELRPDEILPTRKRLGYCSLPPPASIGCRPATCRGNCRLPPIRAEGPNRMPQSIVALTLAAAKCLFIEHANLKRGEFNQRSANRMLRGGICCTLRLWQCRRRNGAADARLRDEN